MRVRCTQCSSTQTDSNIWRKENIPFASRLCILQCFCWFLQWRRLHISICVTFFLLPFYSDSHMCKAGVCQNSTFCGMPWQPQDNNFLLHSISLPRHPRRSPHSSLHCVLQTPTSGFPLTFTFTLKPTTSQTTDPAYPCSDKLGFQWWLFLRSGCGPGLRFEDGLENA